MENIECIVLITRYRYDFTIRDSTALATALSNVVILLIYANYPTLGFLFVEAYCIPEDSLVQITNRKQCYKESQPSTFFYESG